MTHESATLLEYVQYVMESSIDAYCQQRSISRNDDEVFYFLLPDLLMPDNVPLDEPSVSDLPVGDGEVAPTMTIGKHHVTWAPSVEQEIPNTQGKMGYQCSAVPSLSHHDGQGPTMEELFAATQTFHIAVAVIQSSDDQEYLH